MQKRLQEIHLPACDPARLAGIIGAEAGEHFLRSVVQQAPTLLSGSCIFNVNSTGTGGGVAEMLRVLLPYARGVGLDARWLVIDADPQFFEITKRVHNHLYGQPGDGGPLGEEQHRHYEEVLAANATELVPLVAVSDAVILHDPQTAGLAGALRQRGARVVWRCHVGIDTPNEHSTLGWEFLRRYIEPPAVDAFVFSRRAFAPPWLPDGVVTVMPPSIDPFSAKNLPLDESSVRRILAAAGLIAGDDGAAVYSRSDGSQARIEHGADVVGNGPRPDPDQPLVVQVSRWDVLKDMAGVMRAFELLTARNDDAHLVLAGPTVTAVADDPEGAEVLQQCLTAWRQLPYHVRARSTLACLPMSDIEENAAIVNALQRHATVVVQKSLAEGFGLTVSEAMYKTTAVVASAVGGIVDQIVDGESGLLLADPTDLDELAERLKELLDNPIRRHEIAEAGHRRTIEAFLPNRHLAQWLDLLAAMHAAT